MRFSNCHFNMLHCFIWSCFILLSVIFFLFNTDMTVVILHAVKILIFRDTERSPWSNTFRILETHEHSCRLDTCIHTELIIEDSGRDTWVILTVMQNFFAGIQWTLLQFIHVSLSGLFAGKRLNQSGHFYGTFDPKHSCNSKGLWLPNSLSV